LSPSAIDPRISARCEIDLSPGTRTSPCSRRSRLTVAITRFLAPAFANRTCFLEKLDEPRIVGFEVSAQSRKRVADRIELLQQVLAVGARDARGQLRLARRQAAHVAKP